MDTWSECFDIIRIVAVSLEGFSVFCKLLFFVIVNHLRFGTKQATENATTKYDSLIFEHVRHDIAVTVVS